jgi:pimeloyl-ACP methyl ester carboxylesterase
MKLREQAVLFGESKSLVGVVTQGVDDAASGHQVSLVFLNTGIIHRVGHHRMYVTFSRALAAEGYTVLRFDLSGIGDSDNRIDGLAPLESSVSDIKAALDWLETTNQAKPVILIGLCWGADYAVHYAATDPRVVGLVLMDPLIPPTRRYIRDYVRRRILNFRSWVSVAFGSSHLRRMLIERFIGSLARNWEPRFPTFTHPEMRSKLEEVYRNSANRGVQFLTVFTAGGHQTYAEQILEAFPNVSFSNRLRIELMDDSDHVFTSEAARMRLLRLIRDWLAEIKFQPTTIINGCLIAAKVCGDLM